ncbi:histidine kinase [Spirosoma aureum]|uniref:histidine kinase n=1 Tax=Spirosoma aureum TaxID=2692134 RepID=A0A6G9AL14_9BACT|nr:ATP-binding protein [Spirosoma aureum]QIP12975.1 histidine kinase [Spirosoma aureum]
MFLITNGISQPAQPILFQYSTDNGLPQNSAKGIAFDKWGFCWIATEMGLVRFDGRFFTTYGTAEIKGLRSERMSGMNYDNLGNLYISVEGGQVIKIDSETSKTMPCPILIDSHAILISNQGFAIRDEATCRVIEQFHRTTDKGRHYGTCGLKTKDQYVYSEGNVFYLPANQSSLISIRLHTKNNYPKYALVGNRFFIAINSGNKIEAWELGYRKRDIKAIQGSLAKDIDFLSGKFKCYCNVSGSFIYVNGNLHELSIKDEKIISTKVLENINVTALACVYFSKEQNKYYLGSLTDGLLVVQKSHFMQPTLPKTVPDESFYSQAKVNDSTIFCHNLIMSPGLPTINLNIGHEPFAGFDVSSDQQIYFQKNELSLARYDFQKRRLKNLLSLQYPLLYIRVDKTVSDSYVFFSQMHFGRVIRDSLYQFQEFPGVTQIKSVTALSRFRYLIGTNDGLKWYDSKKNKIYQSVLDAIQVRASLSDSDGRVWIATYGKGFYLFEKGKLYKMPLGPKQALKTVHSFIDDSHGYFWLPTNNGLFKVLKTDLINYALGKTSNVYFFRFDRNDGLKTNEFNGGCDPSHVWLKDSLLSISSLKGLIWFYPNKLSPNYPSRPIYIDSLVVNSKPIKITTDQIELKPDFNRLSMLVSSPYFGNQANLNLEYKVAGLDSHWHTLDDRGTFTINNLPAGDYKLLFRRSSNRDKDGVFQLSIPLTVLPWFYNTLQFYALVVFLLIVGIYLTFKQRLRVLNKKSEELEKIVSERTSELNAAVLDLANSEMALLESNRFKDHVITMVLHDMRSPIRFLSLMSGNLFRNHSTLSNNDLHESLSDLYIGTQNLLGFTEQFFIWVMSQQKGFRVNNSWFLLQDLLDEIAGLYSEILKINRNQFQIHNTQLRCYTDYQVLSVIIRNLIDNANKNTAGGLVSISSYAEGSNLVISISDSGMGLDQNQINVFMDREKVLGNHGTGSILIHRMLDQIKGILTITSEIGEGSTFSIRFQNPQESGIAEQGDSVLADC